jgi:hypothetical protein
MMGRRVPTLVKQFFIRSDQFSSGLKRQGKVDAVLDAASMTMALSNAESIIGKTGSGVNS